LFTSIALMLWGMTVKFFEHPEPNSLSSEKQKLSNACFFVDLVGNDSALRSGCLGAELSGSVPSPTDSWSVLAKRSRELHIHPQKTRGEEMLMELDRAKEIVKDLADDVDPYTRESSFDEWRRRVAKDHGCTPVDSKDYLL